MWLAASSQDHLPRPGRNALRQTPPDAARVGSLAWMHRGTPPRNLPSPRPHILLTNHRPGGPCRPRGQIVTIPGSLHASSHLLPLKPLACAMGGNLGALAHLGESEAGPRPVLLL